MKKRIISAATAAAAILGAGAQINSPEVPGYIERAVDMYNDGNYNGCLDQLGQAATLRLDPARQQQVEFYRALATEHTDRMRAAAMFEAFLTDHPSSQLRNRVLFELGNCWYGTDYAKALAYYDEVFDTALDDREYEDLCYRMGYCCLEQGQTADADDLFYSLRFSKRYANAALFYRGYIALQSRDYPTALILLGDVDKTSAPGDMADFYLSQIYFHKGDYRKSLSLATNALKKPDMAAEYIAEAARVAGESAYQLGDDAQAGRYLAYYASLVEKPLPSASYILGLYAYNSGEYPLAIKYMAPVATCDDAMGQSASLYLGQAYLKQGDYEGAVLAFDKAMNMDYDTAVRETAYYNYAVASMEGATVPFGSTVNTFTQFLSLFPDSKYAPQVQDYIITSYITDNNYQAALESINAMKQPSAATLAAKQRVLYVLGTQALGASDNKKALAYLTEANALAGSNDEIAREVSLSYGEALYRAGRYDEAIKAVKTYISHVGPKAENLPIAYYDLGYACYAAGKYKDASEAFEKMLSTPGKLSSAVKADAYNRLGDCCFALGQFAKAADAFQNAYNAAPATGDYALLREAQMAGYQRQYTKKLQTLDNLLKRFPQSDLVPTAMLEKCEAYIQLGEQGNAIATYRQLVKDYPNTAQGRQGYLQLALTLLDNGNRKEAMDAYRTVISRYPTSEEAATAIDQMTTLCAADGTLSAFMEFVNSVDGAPRIDVSEVDRITFEAAEKAYITEDDITRLKDYVEANPDGRYRANALADIVEYLYYREGAPQAYDYARIFVEQFPDNSKAALAYCAMAETEESQGRGTTALHTWQKMEACAPTAEMMSMARSGIMRTAIPAKEPIKALEIAEKILATSAAETGEYAEVSLYKGLALMQTGHYADAIKAWEKAATRTGNVHGIQCAYQLGQAYFDKGDLDNARKWAETVTKANSPYHYWTARAFILLSDILKAKGETYKAAQYLESLRKNYPGTETDIFTMIDSRL